MDGCARHRAKHQPPDACKFAVVSRRARTLFRDFTFYLLTSSGSNSSFLSVRLHAHAPTAGPARDSRGSPASAARTRREEGERSDFVPGSRRGVRKSHRRILSHTFGHSPRSPGPTRTPDLGLSLHFFRLQNPHADTRKTAQQGQRRKESVDGSVNHFLVTAVHRSGNTEKWVAPYLKPGGGRAGRMLARAQARKDACRL